jgi:hypothetical protein
VLLAWCQGQLQPALALNGVGISISVSWARLGGLIVEALGVAGARVNALSFAAVILAYLRLPRTPPQTCLPAERFVTAMRTGLRFARID